MKMTTKQKTAFAKSLVEKLTKRMTVEVSKGERQTTDFVSVTKENLSLAKYLRGGVLNNWDNAPDEEALFKALGRDGGAAGAFLIPSVLSDDVIGTLSQASTVSSMPGVKRVPIAGDKLDFGAVDSPPQVTWTGEAESLSEDTSMAFGRKVLQTHKATAIIKMSRELLDSSAAAEMIVREELLKAVAEAEDTAILQGTGGKQAQGIYSHPRVLSTDLSAVVSIDNLMAAELQIRQNNGRLNGFLMAPRSLSNLRKQKDGGGRYLVNSANMIGAAGVGMQNVATLLDQPVKDTNVISITGRPASGETYIVAGDWTQLIIGDGQNGQIRIESDASILFMSDQIAVRLVKHVGYLIRHPEVFAIIKGIQN
ncbi:hypothetical protein LCGC14_1727420 [marine sediment metagenome]|uniref:Phage capsid-like C-terminal domain-containing protein n=1 Tax=marine sediment metagenome TaxID=412755 RepID=A0A0F9HAL3_9ZZZZ